MFRKNYTFSEIGEIKDGKSKVQILRTGTFRHPTYGEFSIQEKDLVDFEKNFKENKRGIDICVDDNHDPAHRALGWYKDVFREGGKLYALVEWNKIGLELIKEKVYRYFSPELHFEFQDEASGEVIKNLLIGWGITNRPFFKNMEALMACEGATPTEKHYFFNIDDSMKRKFSEIAAEFSAKEKISQAELDEARFAFSELPEDEQNTNTATLSTIESKFSDENAEDEGEGEEAPKGEEEAPATPEVPETPEGEAEKFSEFGGDEGKAAEFSEMLKKVSGLSLDQVKDMQKNFNEQARVLKFNEINKKVSGFVFNENTKEGFILPKAAEQFSEFLTTLTDAQVSKFFEILPSMVRPLNFSEKGKTAGTQVAEFSVPKETPAGVSRDSFVLNQVAQQYSEKNKVKLEDAMLYAEQYVKTHKL